MGRTLITGATGFLGGTLTRRLIVEGQDVIATGRNIAKLRSLPVAEAQQVPADLVTIDPQRLARLAGPVDTIIHCAALSSTWGPAAAFEAANVGATRTVIDLARQQPDAHLIHISSPSVYFRFEDQIAVREDMPLPPPVNAYARTKALADALVQSSGLRHTILRPRGIYGAGDQALLPRLLRAARSGPLPRFRKGAAQTDITHVDDVVDAIRAVLANPRAAQGLSFNVSGGEALPLVEIANAACAAQGIQPRWRDLPLGPVLAAVRLNEAFNRLRPGQPEPRITAYGLGIFAYTQTLDLAQIRDTLGWRPQVTFKDGLARTFPSEAGP